ncbi:MAG: 50S ribosomal protein L19 [candidate division SR1 bacterium CG_4_9_14_3_um_filter_40_9]|nr:MAG: 50S ribosomal protein L19 [candidate division SR1 bacterium CG_4_9_14_3_um_filter_40_9]
MDFARIKHLQEKNENEILPVKPGMLLEIHEKLEGENNRIWKFKCLVLKVKNPQHADGTFTVRGDVAGVMVEKIYPLSFTKFKKVILLDAFKTRKSKLYYLRDKIGKDAKMKSKITSEQRDSDLMKAK